MKVCRKCGIEKNDSEFRKDTRSKHGFRNVCKKCDSARRAAYCLQNTENYAYNKKILLSSIKVKKCFTCGIEKGINEFSVDKSKKCSIHSNCKECRRLHRKSVYLENKDYELKQQKEYIEENKEFRKGYYKKNNVTVLIK